jgi:hypothetical protein
MRLSRWRFEARLKEMQLSNKQAQRYISWNVPKADAKRRASKSYPAQAVERHSPKLQLSADCAMATKTIQ